MLIITATTPNPPYTDEIPLWEESLEKFGYSNYQIGVLPDHGNWMKNCLSKSLYMWEVYQDNPDEGILWLDVDCRVKGKLDFIYQNYDYDFLCYERKECRLHRRGWWLNAGVMYFGPTAPAAALLEDWAKRCQEADPGVWMIEQTALAEAYYATNPKPKFLSLPLTYNCDWDDPIAEEAIIIQEKSSRKYKGIIDSGIPQHGISGPISVEEARKLGTREFT
jgi:hypothetical protein